MQAVLVAMLLALALVGCGQEESNENMDKARGSAHEAAEATREAARDAADATKRAASDLKEEAREAVGRARDATSKPPANAQRSN